LIAPALTTIGALIFGMVIWGPPIAINLLIGGTPNNAWTLWYVFGYPAILLVAWMLGRRTQNGAWRFGAIAVASSYVSALVFVPQTGSLLPFEIVWMSVLATFAAISGAFGSRK
jgi:hypothetical protein